MALTFNQDAARRSIRFVIGDDVLMPYQILHQETANGVTSNVPTNITGYTFETWIWTPTGKFTGSVDVISSANGLIAANFTDSVTGSVSPGCWTWGLSMTNTSSYKRTIIAGDAEAKKYA